MPSSRDGFLGGGNKQSVQKRDCQEVSRAAMTSLSIKGMSTFFHIGTNPCNQLDIEGSRSFLLKSFGNVSLISKEFANQFWNRLAIIDIAGCEHEIE